MLIFQRKYLIILYCLACLIMTPFANAKSINRQAYKVCQTNEEAYWNGSSAQCCEKSIKQVQGTDYYTCCEEWQKAYIYNGSTVCCNEDPNNTPGNICCKGKADNGIEKAYKYETYQYTSDFGKGTTTIHYGCCVNNPNIASSSIFRGSYVNYGLCCGASQPYVAMSMEAEEIDCGGLIDGWVKSCFACPSTTLIEQEGIDGTCYTYGCGCPEGETLSCVLYNHNKGACQKKECCKSTTIAAKDEELKMTIYNCHH